MPQRGWLTPDAIPTGLTCIVLYVPNDDEFYAMLRGALVPLLLAENYEEHGDLTPEECAAWWVAWDASQDWEECT